MNFSVSDIIPQSFRRRGIWVVVTIFMRAILNFVGLAMLLPVLLLILDTDSVSTNPYLNRLYVLSGIPDEKWFIAAVCVAVIAVIALKCLINLLLYRAERDYTYSLYGYLSRRLYIDYHNRGLQFIKSSNSAVLSRNVNAICLTFVAGILRPAATIISETTLFLLLFVALAFYDITAAVLVIAIFLPSIWLYIRMVKGRLNDYGEAENRAQRAKARNVADTYRGYSDIEISNAFPQMLERFDRTMEEVIKMRARNATISILPQMFTEIGLAVGMAVMVIINLGIEGNRMKILFGVFAVAALRLMPSVRNIMSAWSSLRYNGFTIPIIRDARIDETDTAVEISDERFDFRKEIATEGLTFRFDDGSAPVLRNLSIKIAKGERLGIRGRSGSGKTTLFNLLLGLYEPTEGAIYIDGERLSAENRRKWQNTIGYVSQNIFLTDGTIIDNIALGVRPDKIDRASADKAIDMADLRAFTDSLPNGADTRVGECGSRLSGGQRQRIGIARALYKQADILFFDEATSSLDNATERNINEAIEELSQSNKDLTIVIIAHRDSSLDWCDRIIDIDDYE
ncbi:MAG: ABC transporter ATP-binding protein [Alistipes sp.]|nr:ABC transporter ATP-binding protein [Alistipes sp.]